MASLETLPPDQRAVLELVLRRGRTYDQIAQMLSIDRAGVRDRALAAFDALGPQSGVSSERRHLITDYLLGALPQRVADEVRDHLAESPAERAWARVIASELEPVARDPLPEIPLEGGGRAREVPAPAPAPEAVAAAETPAATEAVGEEEPAAAAAEKPARARRPARREHPPSRPTSRVGGAVLLALAAVVVVAVVLVVVLSGGSSKHHVTASRGSTSTPTRSSGSSTTAPATPTTPTTSTSGTQIVAQINLNPPSGGGAKGIAEVLRSAGKTGIAIVAQGLTPNSTHPPNAYAVWLYNSPTDSQILGFVNPGVGKNGRLQTAGGLPTNASHFHQLLVTLEDKSNPKTPGTIVLQGTLSGV